MSFSKSFSFQSMRSFLVFVLFCQVVIQAQNKSVALAGHITDFETNLPLPGASIRAVDLSKKIICGAISDTGGYFRLEQLPESGSIQISLIGYEAISIGDSIYKTAVTPFTVKMHSSVVQTSQVIITGEKPLIEYYVDKQVLNVDKIPGASGGPLVDALAKSGAVIVNPVSKNISLPGGKGVKIKLNGRIIQMDDMVKQLPAESVDKVEIMSVPSAKDDAEGDNAELNVILRTSLGDYFNGSISFNASTQGNVVGNGYFNFKKDKINVFLFPSLSRNKTTMNMNFIGSNSNSIASYKNDGENQFNDESMSKSLWSGFDYELNKNNTLTLSASYLFNGNDMVSRSQSHYYYADKSLNNTQTGETNGNDSRFEYLEYSAFHRLTFANPGQQLTSDALFERMDTRNPSIIRNNYSYLVNPELKNDNNWAHTDMFIIKSDYIHPFQNSKKLEVGYKFTYRDRTSAYSTETMDYSLHEYRDTGKFSNTFNYVEGITAAYAAYADKAGVINYKISFRAEHTEADGKVRQTGQNFSRSYTDIFPTGNISYKIGPAAQVVLSVTRKITRPQMSEINPFFIVGSKYSASAGNPNLQPMYITKYELALSPFITLYYSDGKGKAQRVSVNQADGRLISTMMNLGSMKTYGVDITLMLAPWSISFIQYPEWWSMGNIMLSYRRTEEKGSASFQSSSELWNLTKEVWSINSFFSLRPGYDFDLTVGYSATPEYSDIREKVHATSNLYLSVSRNFFNEKLNISLTGNDLLNSSNFRGWKYGSNYSSYTKMAIENSRNISIGISWKFNDYQYRSQRDVKDGRD